MILDTVSIPGDPSSAENMIRRFLSTQSEPAAIILFSNTLHCTNLYPAVYQIKEDWGRYINDVCFNCFGVRSERCIFGMHARDLPTLSYLQKLAEMFVCDAIERHWPEGPYPKVMQDVSFHRIPPYYELAKHYDLPHINLFKLMVEQ